MQNRHLRNLEFLTTKYSSLAYQRGRVDQYKEKIKRNKTWQCNVGILILEWIFKIVRFCNCLKLNG